MKKADIKALKKINLRSTKRKLSKGWRNKTAENRWLEYQYGWTPLLLDIQAAIEAYTDPLAYRPLVFTVNSGGNSSSDDADWSTYDPRLKGSNGRHFRGNYTSAVKTSCRYVVSDREAMVNQAYGLFTNPLLTAWEVVPYSFVLDWFLPIGDFLAQASSMQGLEFVGGYTSIKSTYKGDYLVTESFGGDGRVEGEITARIRGYELINKRIVHETSPIGIPVFTNPFTTIRRALSAVALLRQR